MTERDRQISVTPTPDRRVAVQVVDDGMMCGFVLQADVAEKVGAAIVAAAAEARTGLVVVPGGKVPPGKINGR